MKRDIVYHGEKVGKHRGIPFYTVGQRKGLGSFGKPVYVKNIDQDSKVVELGDKEELLESVCVADEINYVSKSSLKKLKLFSERSATVIEQSLEIIYADENQIKIKFAEPKNAIISQSLVLYDEHG